MNDDDHELFGPNVKAARDLLVDHVCRAVGIPIIGTEEPLKRITGDRIQSARNDLRHAIAELDAAGRSQPIGPHITSAHTILTDQVARVLGMAPIDGYDKPLQTVTPADIRAARLGLYDAVRHLTDLLFAQPDDDDPPAERQRS